MIDVNKIRKDFPMLDESKKNQGHKLVYLDSAATALKPMQVINGAMKYYLEDSANSHRGDYDLAYRVDKTVDETRQKVANFINADKDLTPFFLSRDLYRALS